MPQLHTASSERYTLHHSLREWSPSLCGGRQEVAAKPPQGTALGVSSKCTFPQTIQLVAWRFRVCGREAGAFRSPPPPLRPPPYKLISYLASAGRGGSVSRRDHDHLTRNRTQAAWAHNSKGTLKPIPSYSSGGGPGEALLLEKRPPPEFSKSPRRSRRLCQPP